MTINALYFLVNGNKKEVSKGIFDPLSYKFLNYIDVEQLHNCSYGTNERRIYWVGKILMISVKFVYLNIRLFNLDVS